MVHSIGIDIVDCARIDRLLRRYGQRFIGRILHEQERRDMSLRRDPVPFVAGRFAAKEAAVKALGQFITDRPAWSAILITKDKQGRPTLDLSEVIGDERGNIVATISISHERSHAVAIVLLTELPK